MRFVNVNSPAGPIAFAHFKQTLEDEEHSKAKRQMDTNQKSYKASDTFEYAI